MATFLHTMVRITDPAIGVDDLDATLGELAAQGIEPERPPYSVREGGSRLCFVRDPDR
jgi:lactoylglutathione lyase